MAKASKRDVSLPVGKNGTSIYTKYKNQTYNPSYIDEMLNFCVETGKSADTWAVNTGNLAMWLWIKRNPDFAAAYQLSKKIRVARLEGRIEEIGDEKLDHKAHQFLLSAFKKYQSKPNQMINNNLTITEQIATATPDQLAAIAKAIEDRILALPAEVTTSDNDGYHK